jgi:hypothetical protein
LQHVSTTGSDTTTHSCEQSTLTDGRRTTASPSPSNRWLTSCAPEQICASFRHLFPLSPSFGDEELIRAKVHFLNTYCGLAHWQSSKWSNLWIPSIEDGTDPYDYVRQNPGPLVPQPMRMFASFLGLKDLAAVRAIEASGAFTIDDDNCDMGLAGRALLGVFDHLLRRMTKTSVAEDVQRLQTDEGLGPKAKRALRLALADKQILIKAREEVIDL